MFGTFTRNEETWELEWNGPARLHDTLNFVGFWVTPSYDYRLYTSRGNNHGVHMKESEYLTKQFTSITENEVEKAAVKAKEYCQEYKKAISTGLSHDKALILARNKIS